MKMKKLLAAALSALIGQRAVFPCWFGSALKLTGVDEFLEGLGLEYRHILRYLTGAIPDEAALIDELGRAIKRFAKRQVSWFKKDRDVHWLNMETDPAAEASQLIEAFLTSSSGE